MRCDCTRIARRLVCYKHVHATSCGCAPPAVGSPCTLDKRRETIDIRAQFRPVVSVENLRRCVGGVMAKFLMHESQQSSRLLKETTTSSAPDGLLCTNTLSPRQRAPCPPASLSNCSVAHEATGPSCMSNWSTMKRDSPGLLLWYLSTSQNGTSLCCSDCFCLSFKAALRPSSCSAYCGPSQPATR